VLPFANLVPFMLGLLPGQKPNLKFSLFLPLPNHPITVLTVSRAMVTMFLAIVTPLVLIILIILTHTCSLSTSVILVMVPLSVKTFLVPIFSQIVTLALSATSVVLPSVL